jgi:hypothetical protein
MKGDDMATERGQVSGSVSGRQVLAREEGGKWSR